MDITSPLAPLSILLPIAIAIFIWLLQTKFPHLPHLISTLGLVLCGCFFIFAVLLYTLQSFYELKTHHVFVLFTGLLIIGLSIFWVIHENTLTTPSTILAITPKQYEPLIIFEDASIFLSREHPDPFILQVENTDRNPIKNLTIKFEIPDLNLQKLINEAPAFKYRESKGNDEIFIITKKDKDNRDVVYSTVSFITSGERAIASLPAHTSKDLDIPENVKIPLSLFIVGKSSELSTEIPHELNAKIVDAGNDKNKWSEITDLQIRRSAIPIPNIMVHAKWTDTEGRKFQQTITLKSMFLSSGGTQWAKSIQSEEYFLTSTMGRLSFENLNQPEQGIYNKWKSIISR